MSKSSSSKSDSYGSYPESITKTPSFSITKSVSRLIKDRTITSPIFYKQALSEIQAATKSLDYSKTNSKCNSVFSDRNKQYKRMVMILLNKMKSSSDLVEKLRKMARGEKNKLINYEYKIKRLEGKLEFANGNLNSFKKQILSLNKKLLALTKSSVGHSALKTEVKALKKDNKYLKKQLIKSRKRMRSLSSSLSDIKSKYQKTKSNSTITKILLKKTKRKLSKTKKKLKKTKSIATKTTNTLQKTQTIIDNNCKVFLKNYMFIIEVK